MNNRRILITGGAGFIGYHLAAKLSDEPENQVVLVDNFVRGRLDSELEALAARPNVKLVSADLTDLDTYNNLGEPYDEVYHLAAIIGVQNVMERPHEVVRVNALSTLYLLDWYVKGGAERLLFSSTSEAYAWTQLFHPLPIPTPEDVPLALTEIGNPRSSYAGSKMFGELAITQYGQIYDQPFAIVRYHNVYGPRMGNAHVIPQLHARALAGQNPLVVYSANYSRAFCYIDDAVEATILAMRSEDEAHHTFNIGNEEEEISIGDLAQKILNTAGVDAEIDPQIAAYDPVTRRCPDITVAREVLGYAPAVNLDDGLGKTLAWYKDNLDAGGENDGS